jgi:hypothetical protein
MFPSSGEHLRRHLLDLPSGHSFSQSMFPIKLLTLVRNFQLFYDNTNEIGCSFLLIRCAEMKMRSNVLVVLMRIGREFVKID